MEIQVFSPLYFYLKIDQLVKVTKYCNQINNFNPKIFFFTQINIKFF